MSLIMDKVTDKVLETKRKTIALHEKAQVWLRNLWEAIQGDQKGWLICLAVLIITVVRSGITYSFGVFVVQLEALWKRPLAEQNWIGTLSFCISLSFAPVSVAFIRTLRYRGYRWSGIIGTVVLAISCLGSSFVTSLEWMFFTHSLLYGVGSSLIYMASSLLIGEYFDKDHKYHVLATSILLCGYPIGSLLFNPINASLVMRFGWRVAYRCTSALILGTGLVCCWFFSAKDSPNMQRLDEQEEDEESTHELNVVEDTSLTNKFHRRCCTWSEIKERPEIALWYLGNGLSYLGFFMPFVNLAYYMQLHGIPPTKSSWAITLLSLAECCTYIVASIMGDYLKGKLVYINVIAASALSVICIFWPIVDVNYAAICFLSIAMGGFLGMTIVYTYAASGEVTQLPIDIAWSFTNLWSGLGILAGPFFSGAIFDLHQSYDDVFYVVGALYAIDALIFGAIVYLQKKRQAKETVTETHGLVDTNYRQTYKISSMRSVSKGSIANGEVDAKTDYGTTTTSTQQSEPADSTAQAWKPNWNASHDTQQSAHVTQQPAPNTQQSANDTRNSRSAHDTQQVRSAHDAQQRQTAHGTNLAQSQNGPHARKTQEPSWPPQHWQ